MSALASPAAVPAPGTQHPGGGVPSRGPEAVVLDWQVGTGTGWQVFGLNLALQLACDGRVVPLLLEPVDQALLAPLHRHVLALSLAQQAELRAMLAAVGSTGLDTDYPVLRALGNGFQGNPTGAALRSARDIGVIFFEDTALTPDALARARQLECIIAGSAWNGALLRAAGLPRVHVIPQGIDPTIFHPAERSGLLRDRFVVFSGGKLEYRKGQDLVIAAFRAFRQRYPEALLLTAWHNPWPQTLVGLDSAGHVRGLPAVDPAGRLQLLPWLAANGLPAGSVLDVGALPNHQMAATVREADVALFPNRCEGGTNLVAMEAMACGVPSLVAANSGQLDLLAEPEAAVPLTRQGPPRGTCPFYQGRDGWGECDVEEMVEGLEAAWQDRAGMRERGRRAAEWMARAWSWRSRAREVLGVLGA